MIQRLSHEAILEATTHRVVAGGSGRAAIAPETSNLKNMEAEAYRLGYAEGYEAGEADGLRDVALRMQSSEDAAEKRLQELQNERERLSALLGGIGDAMCRHVEAMETLALEIALSSLAHAFGEWHEDRQLLQRMCRRMVEEYRSKAVSLAVSASDRACLPEQIDGLTIAAKPGLSPGECHILTERGQVESTVSQRLMAIHEAMQQMLGATPA